jgi:hypothetical protein
MARQEKPSVFARVAEAGDIDAWITRLGLKRTRGRGFVCPVCAQASRCEISRNGHRWRCWRCADHSEPISGGDAIDLVSVVTGKTGADLAAELESILGTGWTPPPAAELEPVPPLYTPAKMHAVYHAAKRMMAVAEWLRSRGLEDPFVHDWKALQPVNVPHGRAGIWAACKAGPVAAYALRSAQPETWGEVRNIMARPINGFPAGKDGKRAKSKPVNVGDGTMRDHGGTWPLAYLGPVRAEAGGVVVLCEGRIDAFLLEEWMPGRCVIGARAAGDVLALWGGLFRQAIKPAEVWMVPQIDPPDQRGIRVGLHAFRACADELMQAQIRVRWWPWRATLEATGFTPDTWDRSGFTDLGDLAKNAEHREKLKEIAYLWGRR